MKKFKKAFTLVELVIVIAVIAILAAVLIPTFSSIISKANESVDTQFVTNLNKQLKIYSAENKIEDESDLWDFLIELYGENVNETLTPKAANKGNHFWYNTQTNTVQYGTLEDVNSNFERTSVNSFDTNSLRIFNNKYYLLDKDGSDIAKVINKFENMTDGESYSNAINSLDQLDTNTKNNLLSKVQNTVIITDNGSFRYDSQAVENIYFAIGLTTITGKLYRYNNGVCGAAVSTSKNNPIVYNVNSITIPDTVKAINEGALFFQEDETVLIYGDFKAVTEIEYIFKNNSTNGKIVCGEDKFLVDDNELTDEEGNSVGNLEYTVEVSKIKFSTDDSDDYDVQSNTLYIGYYYKNAITVNASAYDDSNNLIDKTVVQGDLDNENGCISIDSNGNIKIVKTPKNVSENKYSVTYSLYGYTETLNIEIVFVKKVFLNIEGTQIEVDNAADESELTLSYNGTKEFVVSGLDGFDYSGSQINLTGKSYSYNVLPQTGAKFSYDSINKKIKLLDSVAQFEGDFGKFKVVVTDEEDNKIFEKIVNVTLEDKFNLPVGLTFENTNSYLYRVGNKNEISLLSLYKVLEKENGIEYDLSNKEVSLVITDIITGINMNDYSTSYDSTTGTVKFDGSKLSMQKINFGSFTGVVCVEVSIGGKSISLNIEVIDAYNVTDFNQIKDTSWNSNNSIVILNDLKFTSRSSFNNAKIFGNGFTLDVQDLQDTYNGIINIKGCEIDNVRIVASIFSEIAWNNEKFFSSVIRINGGTNEITNSFIAGGQAPIHFDAGDLTLDNCTLFGGTRANLWLRNGAANIKIKDLTTVQVPTQSNFPDEEIKTVIGAGILVDKDIINYGGHMIIEGDLIQYNWGSVNEKSYFDGDIKTAYNALFGEKYSQYKHNINELYEGENKKYDYINSGIVFGFNPSKNEYLNVLGMSEEVTYKLTNIEGTEFYVYSCVDSTYFKYEGPTNLINKEDENYVPYISKQKIIKPNYEFDHSLNYIAKSDKNNCCYYSEEEDTVIMKIKENEFLEYDTNIIDVEKYGFKSNVNNMSLYLGQYDDSQDKYIYGSVLDTTEPIKFSSNPSLYELKFVYNDIRIYIVGLNGIQCISEQVEFTIKIQVYLIEEVEIDPTFIFTNKSGEASNGKVVDIIDDVYYVSAEISDSQVTCDKNSKWGSVQIDNEPVMYFPIVNGTEKKGTESYRYHSMFSAVKITDIYNNNTNIYSNDTIKSTPSSDTFKYFVNNIKSGVNRHIYWSNTKNGDIFVMNSNNSTELINNAGGASMSYDSNNGGAIITTGPFNTDVGHGDGVDLPEIITIVKYTFTAANSKKYVYYIGYHFDKISKQIGCVTPDTLVTLANGSQKEIQNVQLGELVLAWNFYTGQYEYVPVSLIQVHGTGNMEIIKVNFDDGTELKIIDEHGVYNSDLNEFVFITKESVAEYIGDSFMKQTSKGFKEVKLVSYEIYNDYTTSYNIISYEHYNVILEGMLTMTQNPAGDNIFNPFEINDNMKYDDVKMKEDIEKYGLYTYDDFKAYITYEQFEAFKLSHLKVSVGKGLITHENLIYLLTDFVNNDDYNVNQ